MFENTTTTTATIPSPATTTANEDFLIELANPSSPCSASSTSINESSSSTTNLITNKDPATKAGLPIELMEPVRTAIDNIDLLLDMGNIYPSEVISSQKILSPKKAIYAQNNGTNNNNKKDAFDDLLESFRTSAPTNGSGCGGLPDHIVTSNPVSSYDEFCFDPKHKIHEWKESRRGNIRALLSSLHLVLSDEFRWKAIGMHQLVTDSDVKKIYRLACLTIHPDKVSSADEDTKDIAKMIFMELNEAWSKFEGK